VIALLRESFFVKGRRKVVLIFGIFMLYCIVNNGGDMVEGDTCPYYSMCPVARAYERGIVDSDWANMYCKSNWKECARFQLEDPLSYEFEGVLPDGSIDEDLKEEY